MRSKGGKVGLVVCRWVWLCASWLGLVVGGQIRFSCGRVYGVWLCVGGFGFGQVGLVAGGLLEGGKV